MPKLSSLPVIAGGDTVDAYWRGGDVKFPGRCTGVTEVNGLMTYDVTFCDGSTESGLIPDLVKPLKKLPRESGDDACCICRGKEFRCHYVVL